MQRNSKELLRQMKIFSWIRNKRSGNEGVNNPNPQPMSYNVMHQYSGKEEFSDWPNGLLAIGTFGNNNVKLAEKVSDKRQGIIPSSQEQVEKATAEDLEEDDDKELRLLLNKHICLDKHNVSVEELLDLLQEDVEETDESKNRDAHLQGTATSLVPRGRKDIRSDNKKRGFGKKSLTFLLKKALLCTGGFAPAPMLTDPLPDPKFDRSRMEKILRAMLHKKIYPQRPCPKTTTPTKYLEMAEIDSDEGECEEASHESKWVKTDSEYIVLEI